MTCEVTDTAAARLWPTLLSLKQLLASLAPGTTSVYLVRDPDGWRACTGGDVTESCTEVVRIPLAFGDPAASPFDSPDGRAPDSETTTFLRMYVPLIVGARVANDSGRVFVTGHLAQTLDGRIACRTGHSQWIGNDANLRHAHRLRALNDAVLVGGRTVECDDPRLTVRHVDGNDPKRVVLSGRGRALRTHPHAKVFHDAGCLLFCGGSARLDLPPVPGPVEVCEVTDDEGRIDAGEVCDRLFERGVRSLFVEGGGLTLSSFLAAGRTDVLHVHVAPRILGSGVHGFRLPEVATIDDSARVRMTHFDLDGELLFECRDACGAPVAPLACGQEP